MDSWAYRLKEAYDAGYYKTEPVAIARSSPRAQKEVHWHRRSSIPFIRQRITI